MICTCRVFRLSGGAHRAFLPASGTQAAMGPLQETLVKILYPNVADDAATVKELIGRFEGKQGLYALQNGPGFTRRTLMPPLHRLAPRALAFADKYEADA
jgi:hypothetical protein